MIENKKECDENTICNDDDMTLCFVELYKYKKRANQNCTKVGFYK